MWGLDQKAAIYNPRREASGETSLVGTLILDVQPPELWEANFCCLNHSVQGILLWQLELIHALKSLVQFQIVSSTLTSNFLNILMRLLIRTSILQRAFALSLAYFLSFEYQQKSCETYIIVFILHGIERDSQRFEPDVNSWLIGKHPDAGENWTRNEKRAAEDEMVGWHHWFNGHELGWTPRDGEG